MLCGKGRLQNSTGCLGAQNACATCAFGAGGRSHFAYRLSLERTQRLATIRRRSSAAVEEPEITSSSVVLPSTSAA
jgi:hypothetical protein